MACHRTAAAWRAGIGAPINFMLFRHDPRNPHSLASDCGAHAPHRCRGPHLGRHARSAGSTARSRNRRRASFSPPRRRPTLIGCGRRVRFVSRPPDGIWVGTNGGLSLYHPSDRRLLRLWRGARSAQRPERCAGSRHPRRSYGRAVDRHLRGGLDRLEPGYGSLTSFRHDPTDPRSLSHDRVMRSSRTMRSGSGSERRRAEPIRPRRRHFVRYGQRSDNPQSLRDSCHVMSLYQDRGGVLWVGTREGGASHWNPRSWLLGHYRSAAFRDTR